ncbi:hypothetical protein O181_128611 [Austropuccinia psidii MF-1]|uniref:Uncharacterized protein n=1 Tax=Austropuccinia psidii MF-1 TaxID=1389203 RepID=A0A9Q3KZA0_9BASI|nr:hypothetical protein [Austropuccinia psidii MF-1]
MNSPKAQRKSNINTTGEGFSGDISANPEVIPIFNTTSPSYNLEPPLPFGGDSAPPLPEQPESNSPGTSTLAKDNNPLPKGWVYDNIPSKSPNDVDSNISSGNIVSGNWFHKAPNCFSGKVTNNTPCTIKEAMASSKSDA